MVRLGLVACMGSSRLPLSKKHVLPPSGLKIAITHEPGPDILGDPTKVIKRLKAMGCSQTAFSGSGNSAAEYAKMAADIAKVVPIYKAQGITISYHNHAHEFQKFGDKTGMDICVCQKMPCTQTLSSCLSTTESVF